MENPDKREYSIFHSMSDSCQIRHIFMLNRSKTTVPALVCLFNVEGKIHIEFRGLLEIGIQRIFTEGHLEVVHFPKTNV